MLVISCLVIGVSCVEIAGVEVDFIFVVEVFVCVFCVVLTGFVVGTLLLVVLGFVGYLSYVELDGVEAEVFVVVRVVTCGVFCVVITGVIVVVLPEVVLCLTV